MGEEELCGGESVEFSCGMGISFVQWGYVLVLACVLVGERKGEGVMNKNKMLVWWVMMMMMMMTTTGWWWQCNSGEGDNWPRWHLVNCMMRWRQHGTNNRKEKGAHRWGVEKKAHIGKKVVASHITKKCLLMVKIATWSGYFTMVIGENFGIKANNRIMAKKWVGGKGWGRLRRRKPGRSKKDKSPI